MVANTQSVATKHPSNSRASPTNSTTLPFPFPSGHGHPNSKRPARGAGGAGPISLLADVALGYTAPRKLASISSRGSRDATQLQQLPSISNLTAQARARDAQNGLVQSIASADTNNNGVSRPMSPTGVGTRNGRGWDAQTGNANANPNPTETHAQSHQDGFMRSNMFLQQSAPGTRRDPNHNPSISTRVMVQNQTSPPYDPYWGGEVPGGAEWHGPYAFQQEIRQHQKQYQQQQQRLQSEHQRHHAQPNSPHVHPYHRNQMPRDPGVGAVELLRPNSVHSGSGGLPSPAYSAHDDERHPGGSGGQGWNHTTNGSASVWRQTRTASRHPAADGPWREAAGNGSGSVAQVAYPQPGYGSREAWAEASERGQPPLAASVGRSPLIDPAPTQPHEAASNSPPVTGAADVAITPSTLHESQADVEDNDEEDEGTEEEETSDDDEDEYTPNGKRRRATKPLPKNRARKGRQTRTSARLRVKRERESGDDDEPEHRHEHEGEYELQEAAPELASASVSASATESPALHLDGSEANEGPDNAEDVEGDTEYPPKAKKRAYVRRDAQRRKEQNAQAQKKFRWKKKVMAEQMRNDLDEQRRIVDEMRERCTMLEGMVAEQGGEAGGGGE